MKDFTFIRTFILAAALLLPINAQVIPAGRSIDWSNTGVPGGIPHRTTVYATLNAATYGTGTVDASAAINTAIRNCPANQVIYLPAGTYRLNQTIVFDGKRGVTLRGAGMGKTILRPSGIAHAIATTEDGLSTERTVVSGATKGSRSITVSSVTGISDSTFLDLYNDGDPDFYWTRGGASDAVDRTGQHVMVTKVNGTTLTLEDPLVWDFTRNPRCRPENGNAVKFCGVEDLTVSADSANEVTMVRYWNAYACWIKNVEAAGGCGNEQISLYTDLRCEIRGCYIHDNASTTDGYGICEVMSSDNRYGHGGSTGLLVEDNIFSGLRYAMIMETNTGSVVAYNYTRNIRMQGWPNYHVSDYIGNHCAHGMMYLVEGNVGSSGFQQDGYHGSVSHVTLFRNYFSGVHTDPRRTGNIRLIDLCRYSYYHNVVGNVLGTPAWPRTTIGRYEMLSGELDYTQTAAIYRLGYPNMGNNGYSLTNPPSNADDGGLDPKVKSTLLRWGNFDYQNNAARWEAGEWPAGAAAPANHTLPASLYLSAKPSWWCNDIPWPPIGPDVSGLVSDIPAKRRYDGGACVTTPVEPSKLSVAFWSGDAVVTVCDIRGRAVGSLKGQFSGLRSVLAALADMERTLPNGLYLVRMTGGARPLTLKKVVIR